MPIPRNDRRGPRRRPGADRFTGEPGQEARAASSCIRRIPTPATSASGSSATAITSISASRASASRCPRPGRPLRRGDLRRAHERQRQGRFRSRAEIDWIGVRAQGAGAVSRHLPRRADAGRASRRQGRLRIPRSRRRSATTRCSRPKAGSQLGPFPDHVYQWHREGCELPRGARLLATSDRRLPQPGLRLWAGSRSACSSTPRSPIAQVHRWTGHNNHAPADERRLRAPAAYRRPHQRTRPRCRPGSTASSVAGLRWRSADDAAVHRTFIQCGFDRGRGAAAEVSRSRRSWHGRVRIARPCRLVSASGQPSNSRCTSRRASTPATRRR